MARRWLLLLGLIVVGGTAILMLTGPLIRSGMRTYSQSIEQSQKEGWLIDVYSVGRPVAGRIPSTIHSAWLERQVWYRGFTKRAGVGYRLIIKFDSLEVDPHDFNETYGLLKVRQFDRWFDGSNETCMYVVLDSIPSMDSITVHLMPGYDDTTTSLDSFLLLSGR